jgi:hypothetical protein
MMGRLNHNQGRLFYSFCLDEAVPDVRHGRVRPEAIIVGVEIPQRSSLLPLASRARSGVKFLF